MIMSNYDVLTADTFLHISDTDRFCRCVSDEDLYVMGARFLHTFYEMPVKKNSKLFVNTNRQERIKNLFVVLQAQADLNSLEEGNRE